MPRQIAGPSAGVVSLKYRLRGLPSPAAVGNAIWLDFAKTKESPAIHFCGFALQNQIVCFSFSFTNFMQMLKTSERQKAHFGVGDSPHDLHFSLGQRDGLWGVLGTGALAVGPPPCEYVL